MSCGNLYVQRNESHKGNACVIIEVKQEKGGYEENEYRACSDITYKLELPKSWRIHNTFHAVLLMPYVETEVHGPNFTRPPPEIENNEERYEIETILRHRK